MISLHKEKMCDSPLSVTMLEGREICLANDLVGSMTKGPHAKL